MCHCKIGYEGTHCEYNEDACTSNPCVHGTCVDTPGSYQCQCMPGWQGVNCTENVNACLNKPCLNNGKCIASPHGYQCKCPGKRQLTCLRLFMLSQCAEFVYGCFLKWNEQWMIFSLTGKSAKAT